MNFFKTPHLFTTMSCSANRVLDAVLNHKMDIGIKSFKHNSRWIDIQFCDGTKAEMANHNKYYGWLSEGCIGDFR